jgi:hypothetical protein
MFSLQSNIKGGFSPDIYCNAHSETHWKVLYALHGEFRMYEDLEYEEPDLSSTEISRKIRHTMLFVGSTAGVAFFAGIGLGGLPGKLLRHFTCTHTITVAALAGGYVNALGLLATFKKGVKGLGYLDDAITGKIY